MHKFSGVRILKFEEAGHQAWKKTGMGIISTDIYFRGCGNMSAPLANIQSVNHTFACHWQCTQASQESVSTGVPCTRGWRFPDRHDMALCGLSQLTWLWE